MEKGLGFNDGAPLVRSCLFICFIICLFIFIFITVYVFHAVSCLLLDTGCKRKQKWTEANTFLSCIPDGLCAVPIHLAFLQLLKIGLELRVLKTIPTPLNLHHLPPQLLTASALCTHRRQNRQIALQESVHHQDANLCFSPSQMSYFSASMYMYIKKLSWTHC